MVRQKAGQAGTAMQDENETLTVLARMEEQGRHTLELVRALIAMLVPKQGAREGASLEDLLATIIMQQRETIAIDRGIQASVFQLPMFLTPLIAEAVAERIGPEAASHQ